jgi:peptide/nickel transport system permease protein
MSAQSPSAILVVAPPASAQRGPTPWQRLGATFFVSVGWLLLVLLAAVLGPLLPLPSPNIQHLADQYAGFSGDHLLGTDALGRDMLARLAGGARISLIVGVGSTLLAATIGGLLGLMAGYFRGWAEGVTVAANDALLAFPPLVLVLAVAAFIGHGLLILVTVIGFIGIPAFARITRANTLVIAQREFVLAARAMGAGDLRILVREILPNVVAPLVAFGLIATAVAMIAEGVLAFLGLSVPPPAASWGGMIAEGRASLDVAPQVSFVPAAVFFLTIFTLNLAADRLRRLLDVRESRI